MFAKTLKRKRVAIVGLFLGTIFSAGLPALAQYRSEADFLYSSGLTPYRQNARISRRQLWRINHLAPGQSVRAIRSVVGAPYALDSTTDWYPLSANTDTWIGIPFSGDRWTGQLAFRYEQAYPAGNW